ncbi:MAG TPA: ribonuclease D [Syntrophales bacterium]|nr:ribonuclease D [Syntrophales bacterium]
MNDGWLWIDAQANLDEARRLIYDAQIVSVDTEYDSFRYFRDVLCLIQITVRGRTCLFDPLGHADFSFLGSVFADRAVLKVMHAGDNDVRLLKRNYSFGFANIFDTHQAASILGCRNLALSTLTNQFLGVELKKDKKMQRSRWDTRPLTEEQIRYAVEDTAHLESLYSVLDAELQARDLRKKARAAFERIAAVTWSEKVFNPQACKGINGYLSLSAAQQRAMINLCRWRFEKAKKTNIARFRILTDQNLVELARSGASSLEMLLEAGILSPERISRYGREIVEAVNER